MKRWNAGQLLLFCAVSLLIWALVASVCLLCGSTHFGWPADGQVRDRLDSTLMASLVGSALAAAGVVYQAILRNPLADPYLLGVSSGATLAAYLSAMASGLFGGLTALAALSQQTAALIGAVLALTVVFWLAQRRGRLEPVTLLLVGVIVNSICGALFLLVYHLNLSRDATSTTGGPFRFLIGGINTNLTAAQELVAAICVGMGWCVLFSLSGQLNVATLSEAEAQSLGVRIHRLRWVVMIVASLVTASAVAISGPIAFIGLVCPHLGRLLSGADQRRLFPVATALGAVLLAVADAGSRLLGQTSIGFLPVGVLTGMLGGPFFLLLLWRSQASRDRAGDNR